MLLGSAGVKGYRTVKLAKGEARLLHRLVQEWCVWKANEIGRRAAQGRHLEAEDLKMDTRKARELAERVFQIE